MREYGRPEVVVTDKLRSCGAALREIGIVSHGVVMAWMPPPDGIAMCQGDVSRNVTEKGESIHERHWLVHL